MKWSITIFLFALGLSSISAKAFEKSTAASSAVAATTNVVMQVESSDYNGGLSMGGSQGGLRNFDRSEKMEAISDLQPSN